MMKLMHMLVTIMFSVLAFAAEAEHAHGPDPIPSRMVFWQIFNLTILFAGLIFYLRQPIKDYFKQRRASFLAAAEKSQAARAAAELKYKDLKQKIDDLERTRNETLARAEAEASDLKHQLEAAGKEIATRIRLEAETTARIEIQRARRELQEQFAQEAVSAARMTLTKDISAQDQSRLQGEFVKNIEGVQR